MTTDDGLDTPLARLLHARGRLPLDVLRGALTDVRASREADDRSLAVTLVSRGLLREDEARALLVEASGPVGWGPGGVIGGRYRIERRLGQGGMGAVDEVTELATGARRALKSLPAVSDRELLLRFRREGEALARVDGHPNVVRVHAAGQDQGRLWLLMDLEEGGDLARRVQKGPLPIDEVVRLGVALAAGLAHVHRHGVLHRDLKPQNVLFDAAGAPKLTDFGLARTADARSLTQTGELLGTPAYMAPEQATGEVGAQDERTDVYGLGAVLYHALAGGPPFGGSTPVAVLKQVLEAAPSSPRRLRADCPAWLEAVVLRAMARRPDDRFASAAALREALLDAGRAGVARRRRGVAVGLVGGALATIAAGVAVASLGEHEPRDGAVAAVDTAVATASTPPERPRASTPAPVTSVDVLARAGAASVLTTAPPPWLVDRASDGPATLSRLAWEHGESAVEIKWMVDFLLFSDEGRALDPDAPGAGVAWLARLIDAPWGADMRAEAWFMLGRAYRQGLGVAPDDQAAVVCFQEAAAQGALSALELLARASWLGTFHQPKDPGRAFELAERALVTAQLDDAGRWLSCAELQARVLLEHPGLRSDRRLAAAKERLEGAAQDEVLERRPRARLGLAWLAEVEGRTTDAAALHRDVAEMSSDPEMRADALRRLWVLAGRSDATTMPLLEAMEREHGVAKPPDDRPFARALGLGCLDMGDVGGAARWLVMAAAPEDAMAGRETELCARVELARLARQELEAGRPFVGVDRVLAGLRLAAQGGSGEAGELERWFDEHAVEARRYDALLDALAAQVGPAKGPPAWLQDPLRSSWPTAPGDVPDEVTLKIADSLLSDAHARRREAWAAGVALTLRVVRETPDRAVQGRAWAMLGGAIDEGLGVAGDESGVGAVPYYRVAAALGSLEGAEHLARALAGGLRELPRDPGQAFKLAAAALQGHPSPGELDLGAWVGCAQLLAGLLMETPELRTRENLGRVQAWLGAGASRVEGERQRRVLRSLDELKALAPEQGR